MRKLLISVVVVLLLFITWKQLSTFSLQGYWNATLQTRTGNVPFNYQIQAEDAGDGWFSAWVGINGAPERPMEKLQMEHRRIRFDLPVHGRVYHLEGTVVKRKIDGTWTLDNGTSGIWHAQRRSFK